MSAGLHELVWRRLALAAATPPDPMRRMTVATAGAGGPDLRMVVLREVRADDQMLVFHTDARSPKCAALATDPRLGLLLWDDEAQVQLRCRGVARLNAGDERADMAWRLLNPAQRALYNAPQAPGARKGDPDQGPYGRAAFRLVECRVTAVDMLYLREEGHARWLIDYAGGDSPPTITAIAP